MNYALDSQQQELLDAIRDFCDNEIAPKAATRDQEGRFEDGLVSQLAEMGLLGLYIPEQYGGAGLDCVTYAAAVEELSRACGATGILMSAHHSLGVDPVINFGNEEQKQKYLPRLASGEAIGCFSLTEPGSGSDAGAARCRAVEHDDGWRISGTKCFVTNAAEASVVILFAVTSGEAEKHRMTAFIVDTDMPGWRVSKLEKKLGIRASSTAELVFEDCLVPKANQLGEVGKGLNIALATLDGGRIGVAAQAIGIARAAFEHALEYSQTREQFDRPISKFQAIQWKLSDMQTELMAARMLMRRAAWHKQIGRNYSTEAAMAKLYASEMSSRVTNAALQVYGGWGYCEEYPAERLLRDAKITELYEGTSEIQRLVIARNVLRGWLDR